MKKIPQISKDYVPGWMPVSVETPAGIETHWRPQTDAEWLASVDHIATELCPSIAPDEDELEGYRQDARVALRVMGFRPRTPTLAGDDLGVID